MGHGTTRARVPGMRRPHDVPDSAGETASPPVQAARGRIGEQLAALYLESIGFHVLGRNLRAGRLEVDLLAERAGELVVIEVRLRTRGEHGSAEETVDFRKRARLRSAGRQLWEERGREDLALRFDLVAITIEPHGLSLRHHARFLDPEGPGAEVLRRR